MQSTQQAAREGWRPDRWLECSAGAVTGSIGRIARWQNSSFLGPCSRHARGAARAHRDWFAAVAELLRGRTAGRTGDRDAVACGG